MIEDWEIGALYWNCLKAAQGNQAVALEKDRQRYENEFIKMKDIYLFLGTTQPWYLRKSKNQFEILGVFHRKKESEMKLF
jgi:hypothetical protein